MAIMPFHLEAVTLRSQNHKSWQIIKRGRVQVHISSTSLIPCPIWLNPTDEKCENGSDKERGMNPMKLVIPLHSMYWSIHTKDESKRGTAFAFIFGVN